MPVLSRSADRFQRALSGERVSDAQVAELVETSRRLVALGSNAPAPDARFVADLRSRLMTEAATMPAPGPAAARAAQARDTGTRSAPVVFVVGRGLPRAVAGATASALLVGAVVGAAARGTVPGDALYPVKGWLDGVAVRLADSDLDRGRTHLAQAQEHISNAREVADDERGAEAVTAALESATVSVREGQRALDRAWTRTGNPQALLAMRDFASRALPQVDALRTEVPAESLPALADLESLLRQTQEATARRVAACGATCSSIDTTSLVSPTTVAPTTSPTSTGGAVSAPPAGVTAPPTAVTATGGEAPADGVPVPGATASGGGVGVGVGGGSSTLTTGGASVGLPTVTVSVPVLPSATVTVPLPTVTAGTTGVTATVPSSTLGPATLPGVTITLP
jgi:Domain of unknown function (DUF5667)